MTGRVRWATLAASLILSSGLATEPPRSLADLPVAGTEIVAPAVVHKKVQLAKGSGTPLDIAFAIAGPFEGSVQHVIQVNEGGESPTVSRVTVLRDGLLDDSVRGERWDIAVMKNEQGAWIVKEVTRARRCWRGPQTDRFDATPCR